MQLYLQFGHGMISMSKDLLTEWRGGGVILSPRDLKPPQLERVAEDARQAGAEPLLDPQCYVRTSDHNKLTAHAYFECYQQYQTTDFLSGNGASSLLAELAELSTKIGIHRHILPGLYAEEINDDWFTFHTNIIAAAPKHFGNDPLLATVALASDALKSEETIEQIVEAVSEWDVQGVYLVAETPTGYLADDPLWLTNLMVLSSGIKLAK